ncbi:spermatogenesis-associated serine-rich protein 2-like [Aphelocoma coerulescens]|uniref:spermatogenesis-associated serine-rich protein 2-like n=1 Tax=Aphelocoma coerulescens TaxID=39617 RepID=UPI0036052050
MSRKQQPKDPSGLVLDLRSGAVRAQGGAAENMKEKIGAVRAVVPNRSNTEIALVLQHFDNSVPRAVQAFMEGNASEVLKEWTVTGKKKHKKKKPKAQPPPGSEDTWERPAPGPGSAGSSGSAGSRSGSSGLGLAPGSLGSPGLLGSPGSLRSSAPGSSAPGSSALGSLGSSAPGSLAPGSLGSPGLLGSSAPGSSAPGSSALGLLGLLGSLGSPGSPAPGSSAPGSSALGSLGSPGSPGSPGRALNGLGAASGSLESLSDGAEAAEPPAAALGSEIPAFSTQSRPGAPSRSPRSSPGSPGGKKLGPSLEKSLKDLQRCAVALARFRALLRQDTESSVRSLKRAFGDIQSWSGNTGNNGNCGMGMGWE